MAHFAELDENNMVLRIIVIHNNELLDANGQESEQQGIDFCKSLYGADTRWAQTSYNNSFRYRYAVVNGHYDPVSDVFVPPKPSDKPSYVLDNAIYDWVPPVPYPTDGHGYVWIEDIVNWVKVTSKPVPDNINRYIWNKTTEEWEQVTVIMVPGTEIEYVWDPVLRDFTPNA